MTVVVVPPPEGEILFQKCQNRAKTTPQRATCKVKREEGEKREKREEVFNPKKNKTLNKRGQKNSVGKITL